MVERWQRLRGSVALRRYVAGLTVISATVLGILDAVGALPVLDHHSVLSDLITNGVVAVGILVVVEGYIESRQRYRVARATRSMILEVRDHARELIRGSLEAAGGWGPCPEDATCHRLRDELRALMPLAAYANAAPALGALSELVAAACDLARHCPGRGEAVRAGRRAVAALTQAETLLSVFDPEHDYVAWRRVPGMVTPEEQLERLATRIPGMA